MNSLTELNGYAASLTLPYTDLRAPNVLFNATSATNQSQTVNEGFGFLSSVGIEITEIVNPGSSNPTYTINVSLLPGTTVTWPSLPSGLTITNPSSGIYTVSGMSTVEHWNAIKQATITTPANYFGVWSYVSSVGYYSGVDGDQQKVWTTAVTTNDVQFLSTPVAFTYQVNAVSNITNTPQIANLDSNYPGATWTVTGTPNLTSSIDTWTTTGTGGTFSVNPTTKIFTITGTRTQVNSRLAGLQIDSNATNLDFVLTYAVSNSLNASTESKIQIMSSVGLLYLSSPSIDYFSEDADTSNIDGYPVITDSSYDGSGGYTLTITPSSTSAIQSMNTIGSTGSSSFNATTKVLTVGGTRTEVNNRLATLTMVPGTDWGSDFTLSYTVVTPRYDSATKIQALLCSTNDTEISNMNVSRNYIGNNGNTIFATNTPQIIDLDTAESLYTIGFSVNPSLGLFSFSANEVAEASLTFTGTRAQCNAKFANVRFWPVINSSANGTFTYTQLKNGIQQVSQTVGLVGTAGTYSNSRTVEFLTGQIYTPELGDVLYATAEVFLLGGGAGGGANTGASGTALGTGGGGGGAVNVYQNVALTQTPYTITIGAGGQGQYGTASTQWATNGGTTSAFGYSAAGGLAGTRYVTSGSTVVSVDQGGSGSGVYAGTGGLCGTGAGGIWYGGGGGAGGGGIDNTYLQNGGGYTTGSGLPGAGVGGTFNGCTFNGQLFGHAQFAGGGSGGTSAAASRSAQNTAGRGACGSSVATPARDGWGGGGGGAYGGKVASNGGAGRVMIRFNAK